VVRGLALSATHFEGRLLRVRALVIGVDVLPLLQTLLEGLRRAAIQQSSIV
jgi:hypothetical protein